jgi:hypothetical protein
MRCITLWAETEIRVGTVLAAIFRLETGSAFAGVQMYLRLNSAEARRSVLDEAAKSMLSEAGYPLFELTMKALKAVRERRNDFAHGLWGLSNDLPDALLWVKADDQLAYEAILSGAHPLKASGGILGSVGEASHRHQESIMVYRQPDLEQDLQRAQEALVAVNYLELALHPYGKERDAMRQELSNVPLIRKYLQARDPETPPESQS